MGRSKLPRLLRWMAPYRKPQQEAADQMLGKRSKIDTLSELTTVQQIREIARDEVAAVRQYRESKVPGVTGLGGGKGGDSDTILADDMTINAGRSNLPELLLIAVLAVGGYWFLNKDKPEAPPTKPAEIEVKAKKKFQVFFVDEKGNPVHVPHVNQRPAATPETTPQETPSE